MIWPEREYIISLFLDYFIAWLQWNPLQLPPVISRNGLFTRRSNWREDVTIKRCLGEEQRRFAVCLCGWKLRTKESWPCNFNLAAKKLQCYSGVPLLRPPQCYSLWCSVLKSLSTAAVFLFSDPLSAFVVIFSPIAQRYSGDSLFRPLSATVVLLFSEHR